MSIYGVCLCVVCVVWSVCSMSVGGCIWCVCGMEYGVFGVCVEGCGLYVMCVCAYVWEEGCRLM